MSGFIMRRFAEGILVVFLASLAVFFAVRMIPGDPAQLIAGDDATTEDIVQIRERLGLNDSVPVQYWNWVTNAVTGDFGTSFTRNQPVRTVLGNAVQPTIELAIAGYLFATLVGVPIGIFAGIKPGGFADYFATAFTVTTLGIPNFILGLLLLWVVGVELGWLPVSGRVAFSEDPLQALKFLILPTIAVGSSLGSVLARFVRASMQEVMNQDYVRTARAKGLRERDVVLRHAMRNALIPVIAVAALQVGGLISGALVVEVVFSRPGFGSLLIASVVGRDYVLLQALLAVLVAIFVAANTLADVTYGFADPRIRVR
jgi:peptide/nickel transport system permease protein